MTITAASSSTRTERESELIDGDDQSYDPGKVRARELLLNNESRERDQIPKAEENTPDILHQRRWVCDQQRCSGRLDEEIPIIIHRAFMPAVENDERACTLLANFGHRPPTESDSS